MEESAVLRGLPASWSRSGRGSEKIQIGLPSYAANGRYFIWIVDSRVGISGKATSVAEVSHQLRERPMKQAGRCRLLALNRAVSIAHRQKLRVDDHLVSLRRAIASTALWISDSGKRCEITSQYSPVLAPSGESLLMAAELC